MFLATNQSNNFRIWNDDKGENNSSSVRCGRLLRGKDVLLHVEKRNVPIKNESSKFSQPKDSSFEKYFNELINDEHYTKGVNRSKSYDNFKKHFNELINDDVLEERWNRFKFDDNYEKNFDKIKQYYLFEKHPNRLKSCDNFEKPVDKPESYYNNIEKLLDDIKNYNSMYEKDKETKQRNILKKKYTNKGKNKSVMSSIFNYIKNLDAHYEAELLKILIGNDQKSYKFQYEYEISKRKLVRKKLKVCLPIFLTGALAVFFSIINSIELVFVSVFLCFLVLLYLFHKINKCTKIQKQLNLSNSKKKVKKY
ncbi:Pv-fam-d protein [Plasmodium ovale wallikeri]|uniref:Pv-fam-d protein n=1 Tax=Plasmodium ovale wallikeri TaxID=864142 RepID=A0A1A9AN40_PLAOA|nr:Pv-fam-d protein [Plasmodium ovale wallikeri]SBT57612.1 Pv-fam-d protein [Plasmodium ovale wallikeri]